MTHRERHMAWLEGKNLDRVPDWEFRTWDQTVDRWHKEGLPAGLTNRHDVLTRQFHTDDEDYGPSPWVNVEVNPGFTWEVVSEKGDTQVIRDNDGALGERMRPELGASIPRYIRYAIETRKDWEKLRDERLRVDDPARVPANLAEMCRKSREADYPVVVWAGSVYGWLRNWMGVERISEAFVEEPEWIAEMMEHLTSVRLAAFARLAEHGARVDRVDWWEDMCFKTGPLISPAMFVKFMVPHYRRTCEFMREACGTRFNMLDCDGNIHALVGPWLDGGINVMFPIESAHTDVFRIRREFGRKVPLRGAFDKRALIAGTGAIDREFDRLMPLIGEGILAPHTDHLVPPDVSYENYRYYRRRKCAIIGKEYREGITGAAR